MTATHGLVVGLMLFSSQAAGPAAPVPARPYNDELFAAIAAARGLTDLPESRLTAGVREIRIRGDISMVSGFPTAMLRVVQGPGDTRGELLLFRRLLLRSGNPAPRPDERCAPLREQHICVRELTLKSGDWASVAARLDDLGAWSVSTPCDRSSGDQRLVAFTDSGSLHVQRLAGASFSAYSCNAPRQRGSLGAQARAIDEYVSTLFGPIPDEPDVIAR